LCYQVGDVGKALKEKNLSISLKKLLKFSYHVITERMNNERRDKMSGAHEKIRRVNAKDWRVKELKQTDQNRRFLVHSRSQSLDHVMKMCWNDLTMNFTTKHKKLSLTDAEKHRRDENRRHWREALQK
jgi:hypothetical protein